MLAIVEVQYWRAQWGKVNGGYLEYGEIYTCFQIPNSSLSIGWPLEMHGASSEITGFCDTEYF